MSATEPAGEPAPAGDAGGGTPMLIAYDGSQPARRAIQRAGALFPGRPAIVLTTWTGVGDLSPELMLVPGGALFAAAGALSDLMSEQAERLAAEGRDLARDAGLEAEAATAHGEHAPWRGIVAFAEECDAAVIVLGSRGHSTVVAAVLGSVSTGVLHHSTRPVLVVR